MKRFCIFFIMALFLFGCNPQEEETNKDEISSKDVSAEYDAVYVLRDGIPISISDAWHNLYQVYKELYPDSINYAHFSCEGIQIVDDKIHYIFRAYNDTDTHIVTFGWYFVDVYTGDAYNAGPGINELLPVGVTEHIAGNVEEENVVSHKSNQYREEF